MPDFVHLHCHTQFSLLDGASNIAQMMDKAVTDGQAGVALTDHGNMFGAFSFVEEARRRKLKPIVGCEFYLVEDRHRTRFSRAKGERDKRFHQLLLAKNAKGYENLSKLCSLGFIEGLYSKFPRIDKELVEQYREGVIATSCCIGAEIPQTILSGDLEKAEKMVRWWYDMFGEDFYIELQRHRGMDNIDGTGMSQEDVNQVLIGFANKYDIKTIATNDSHYIEEEDWKPHDILLCVNTGSKMEEQNRFKFNSSDFYFKTQTEMNELFKDVPEAIDHTMEIFDKVDTLQLERDILLPNFPLPPGFKGQKDYLKHLVYEGAKVRYGEITPQVKERLDHELNIIGTMGYEGYFLIVQDFIRAAREMGVAVGPGRGSAAGSAVAYCLAITNIDPIHYNLLFERFLNPERVSMPDIDIDFDDEGRQRVIEWVIDKYGKNQVAQIITFGSMAAKSSIRDVGRVLDLPLSETDRIAKLVPTGPKVMLNKFLGKQEKKLREDWQAHDLQHIVELNEIMKKEDLEGETIRLARDIEGSIRNRGIHAAGLIIAPDDITKYIPVCTAKETDLLVTQFDGNFVERAGMLKMDFLGLKTLSIIKTAIDNVVKRNGEDQRIDPDLIPLDDEKTYELFQRGEMTGIFQFESAGMRKYLKELQPTNIEDLISMVALYRPGPMDNIPSFIARKHGREPIEYPHEWLEEILKPTYGIMVYQEQIMQTAQIMAGYDMGNADLLRRAMGKKKMKEMEKHRNIFIEGALEKSVDKKKADEIFSTMERFASYGFNRSHAAAYAVLAFQTAYLKTHYPAEFMASVLTHNRNDITKLNLFLRECKRMGTIVLGPDVNESDMHFTVNREGYIRFGLSALKGVGEGPVAEIIAERSENGFFSDPYELVKRVNLRAVNKKCFESLVLGGALDCFEQMHRAQYFSPSEKYETFLEHLVRFGHACQKRDNDTQQSLFGESIADSIPNPSPPIIEEWNLIEKLTKEKEVTGIFISGHPLDNYRVEVEHFSTTTIDQLGLFKDRSVKLAVFVSEAQHRISKKGTGYGIFRIQDYTDSIEVAMFSEDYQKFKHLFEPGSVLFVKGKYEKRYKSEEYQLKIKDAKQLESLVDQELRSVTINVPIERINESFMEQMESLCAQFSGKHQLKFAILHEAEKIVIQTFSASMKVKADNDFIQMLEDMELRYALN